MFMFCLLYFFAYSTFQVDVKQAQVFVECCFADSLAINCAFIVAVDVIFYIENMSCYGEPEVALATSQQRAAPTNYPTQVINYL